jgi:hypothetical protein
LFQNRYRTLASLMFVSLFAAHAARAQAIDDHLSLPGVTLPDSGLPPVTLASLDISAITLPPVTAPDVAFVPPALHTSLPDDPSAALQSSSPENEQNTQSGQSTSSQSPSSQTPSGQPSSAGDPSASVPNTKQTEEEKAEQQLKQQEHQRVLGVMATFNTTRNHDALPLTPSQKFQLFFKSQTDPWPFGLAAVIAGLNQAQNSPPEYGQGMQGYAKRFGATYTDSFIGNFFGNAVLTSLWREDPRYFQKGTGSFASRFLWAATATVWCKRDNGTWGPNYANVAGNLIGAAIANVYYPQSERTVHDTIYRGLSVTAQGIIGAEVIEFWPDMVRHYRRKQAEKAAKRAAQQDAQDAQAAKPASKTPPAQPQQTNPPNQ